MNTATLVAIILLTLAIVVIAILSSLPAPEERARLAAQPVTPLPASRYLFGLLLVAVFVWLVTA